ncbi:MAG: hypothetical protein QOG73_3487, partial [Acetobacteraceae bacterium]|nr:hypothetical protein [Acetobacteraceae bacterium]
MTRRECAPTSMGVPPGAALGAEELLEL